MRGPRPIPLFLLTLILMIHAAPCYGELAIRITPEPLKQGQAFLLRVVSDTPVQSLKGWWMDRSIPFLGPRDGRTFLGLMAVDLAQKPGRPVLRLEVMTPSGKRRNRRVPMRVLAQDFPVQKLTLPRGMVTLSKETLDRVLREKAEISALFERLSTDTPWPGEFAPPLNGKILSPFGARRILNGEPRSPHSGVDLQAAEGTPVHAAADGRVALVAEHYFAGTSVYLDHGGGVVSMYFHLSKARVAEGDRVREGDVIGRVGMSGRATGPHLHWGIRVQGNRIDPFSLVRLLQGSITR